MQASAEEHHGAARSLHGVLHGHRPIEPPPDQILVTDDPVDARRSPSPHCGAIAAQRHLSGIQAVPEVPPQSPELVLVVRAVIAEGSDGNVAALWKVPVPLHPARGRPRQHQLRDRQPAIQPQSIPDPSPDIDPGHRASGVETPRGWPLCAERRPRPRHGCFRRSGPLVDRQRGVRHRHPLRRVHGDPGRAADYRPDCRNVLSEFHGGHMTRIPWQPAAKTFPSFCIGRAFTIGSGRGITAANCSEVVPTCGY